jgi:hypothetical protein
MTILRPGAAIAAAAIAAAAIAAAAIAAAAIAAAASMRASAAARAAAGTSAGAVIRAAAVIRAVAALLVLALAACERADPITGIQLPVVSVEPAEVALDVGQTVQLVATVKNVSNTAVEWTSLEPSVATVSAAGELTGVAPGTAIVVVVAVANPIAMASVVATIRPAPRHAD